MTGLGRALVLLGLCLVAAGVLVTVLGKIPFLGRLPGDLVVRRPGFTFYFPLGTSIVVSLLLSLLLWLLRR
ncbi:MAG: DUF2905 domain-containing protein [Deltaproteobacteria bacterium]|nr:DUF2905 domain-containing protein [Deltaproteobacteria bacterium]